MEYLAQIVLSLVVGTLLLKGAIRLVDGFNVKNTWGAAFGWTLLFSICGPFAIGPVGILMLIAYLMVLNRYYEIGPLRTVGVIVAQFVLALGLSLGAGVVLGAFGVA